MKRDNVNYLLVGSFVLLMAVVLLYALFRISGHSARGERYHTHFANVTGIKVGSIVTYEGFEVGNVAEIAPVARDQRTVYRVTLNLRNPLKIPADSQALIAVPGMLAAPQVEIREGSSREFLASDGEIPGIASTNLMQAVSQLAGDLGALAETGLKPLLVQLGQQVERVGGSLDQNLPATLASLRNAASRVETLFSPENQQQFNGLLRNANATAGEMLKLSRELHAVRSEVAGLVRDSRQVVSHGGEDLQGALRRADALLHQLESAGRHINEFSRTIRENPSVLIQNRPPVDAAGEPQ